MTHPQTPPGDEPNDRPEAEESLDADSPKEDDSHPEDSPEPIPAEEVDSVTGETSPAAELDEAEEEDGSDESWSSPSYLRLVAIIGAVVVLIVVGVSLGIFLTRSPDESQVIARVGDAEITRAEFTRNYSAGQDAQALLDQLINLELLVQAAREEGTTIDEAQVDQQIQGLREQHGAGESFEQFLQQANIASEEDLRELIARQQLIEAMVIAHTEAEHVRSRHILLRTDNLEDEEAIEERKAEAEELLAEIEDGADFAELASEHSDDPGSAESGGELGWMPRGVFVPEFDEAVFSMEPDEVRLVQTQFGWHIIEVQDAPEMRSLDAMSLQSPAGQQAINESFLPWLDGLRDQAEQDNQVDILVEAADLVPPPPSPNAQP